MKVLRSVVFMMLATLNLLAWNGEDRRIPALKIDDYIVLYRSIETIPAPIVELSVIRCDELGVLDCMPSLVSYRASHFMRSLAITQAMTRKSTAKRSRAPKREKVREVSKLPSLRDSVDESPPAGEEIDICTIIAKYKWRQGSKIDYRLSKRLTEELQQAFREAFAKLNEKLAGRIQFFESKTDRIPLYLIDMEPFVKNSRSPLALTDTYRFVDDLEHTSHAATFINSNFTFFLDVAEIGKFSARKLAFHEIGHSLGLLDTKESLACRISAMYPRILDNDASDYGLTVNEMLGLERLYPSQTQVKER